MNLLLAAQSAQTVERIQGIIDLAVSGQLEGKITLEEYGEVIKAIQDRVQEINNNKEEETVMRSSRQELVNKRAEQAFGVNVFVTSLIGTLPAGIIAGVKASNEINKEETAALVADIKGQMSGAYNTVKGLFSKGRSLQ